MYSTPNNIELISALKPLIQNERILISGASGWLGKNLIELILDLNDGKIPDSVLLTAASSRKIELSHNRNVDVTKWDRNAIQEFAPTTFINLAFLTRDRLLTIAVDEYIETNLSIINNGIWALSLPSVNYVLTTSSGVACQISEIEDFSSDPYGKLKKYEELVLSEKAHELGKNLLILRVWTTSGKYIKFGDLLALQSLLTAVLKSENFVIESSTPVWRTYVNPREMFGLAMLALFYDQTGIINSGGIEVELTDLAKCAVDTFDSKSQITRSNSRISSGGYYVSRAPDLNEIAAKFQIPMMTLSDQLIETASTMSDLINNA
jgi:nucleoside-diphosphate-sugar epimerase